MPKLNAILCEFFGTLLLVVSVSCAALANTAAGGNALFGEALLNGLPVAIIVTFTLSTSGGQINPAVTIGLLCIGKIKMTEAVVFVMVQVAGAASAGWLIKQILLPNSLDNVCMEHRDLVNQFLKLKALELKVSRLACFAFPYAQRFFIL